MKTKEFSLEIGNKKMTAIFSDLAERANGSVILNYGNTSVLATVVMSPNAREGTDFFPLTVDYEERFYAAGEILGSRFIRREGRPSDEAILGGRIVDRTIRPLFPTYVRNEVQVVITVLSIDEDDPDVLAVNAASLSLLTSDIPWNGPVSSVRVGKQAGSEDFVVNPTYEFRRSATIEFDAIISGKDGTINMIEVGAREVSEDETIRALEYAIREIKKLQEFQMKIAGELKKEKKSIEKKNISPEALELFAGEIAIEMETALFTPKDKTYTDLKNDWILLLKEKLPDENNGVAADFFEEMVNDVLHKAALQDGKRADGRKMDEIRPLFVKAGGISSVLHGVGIFYRGGTHILSILTLGGPKDAQILDSMDSQGEKRFMHHYNFPPFSSGEAGRIGGLNRRMIGHGALAEKALLPIIPSKEDFPYTVRIVSEALASNGSTSMGSVCASSLALMDAGVPIKAPVAGIAMGLMLDQSSVISQRSTNNKQQTTYKIQQTTNNTQYTTDDGQQIRYKILTDIQGPEDHHGDMDFKVAGTKDGITAVQMDVKVDGIPIFILREALSAAKKARITILGAIKKEIEEPRKEFSPSAPKVIKKKIKETQIGLVIGPSGQTIKRITRETGAEIDIEEDGTIFILGKNGIAKKAEEMIEEIVHEYQPGERLSGVVSRIMDFGAFVKVGPHAEGLVHISELAPVRVERVADILKEGDVVPVMVKEIDEKGRLNFSIKSADQDFFKEKLGKDTFSNHVGKFRRESR